ncbi:hypothetical protein EMCRGX_G029251 [Ephydatia muelleri]
MMHRNDPEIERLIVRYWRSQDRCRDISLFAACSSCICEVISERASGVEEIQFPGIEERIQFPGMEEIQFPGMEEIQFPGMEEIQFPGMEEIQFPGMEEIQFPGMEEIQFPGMEEIQFSRIEFLRKVENKKGAMASQKEVAIKKIKMDDDMKLKTHLEVQIMRQLQHLNIITLMGISSNKSELLIVMNLVNGFNLEQVIFKQALPLDTSTVRSIAVQITKALTYMHGRSPRVIHHDIKPSNIMVSG